MWYLPLQPYSVSPMLNASSRALLPVAMAVLFLVFPAHGAEPYGKRFVAAGAVWPEEVPPGLAADASLADPQQRVAARELVGQLEARLREEELARGPYAPALAETLNELGRALELTGDDAAALKARERALHLTRVNDGLYSASQGPLVRDILAAHRRRGEFQLLDERYEYFFRLYGAGRPPWSEVRWSAVREFLRWQREAIRRRIDGNDFRRRLLELHQLHEELLESLRPEGQSPDWQRERDVAMSQLKTLYLVEDLVEPVEDFGPLRRDRIQREDPVDFDLYRERLENLKRTLRSRGRELMEGLLAIVPREEVLARYEIRLALADWLQWHGATREAEASYLALWADLQREGKLSLANTWFGAPVPLPDNGVFWQPDGEVEAVVDGVVELSESGRARMDIDQVAEPLQRSASRLRRYLQGTRFRPRIVAGEVVDSRPASTRWIVFDN